MEFLFECSSRYFARSLRLFMRCRLEHEKRNSINYLQATMHYYVYYINILLTRTSRLNARFKQKPRCHPFIALNSVSDMSAADWLSRTHVKNYRKFSRVVIRFFSLVEIPIKRSSLYNEIHFQNIFHGIDHHWKNNTFATCGEQVDIWDENRSEPIRSFSWGVDTLHSIKFNPIEVQLQAEFSCVKK